MKTTVYLYITSKISNFIVSDVKKIKINKNSPPVDPNFMYKTKD